MRRQKVNLIILIVAFQVDASDVVEDLSELFVSLLNSAAELIGVDINVSKESFEVILALCADSRCFDSLEYFRECYI